MSSHWARQGRVQAYMPEVCTCVMVLLSCAVHIDGRHYSLLGHRFPQGQPSLLLSHTSVSRKLKHKLPSSHYWGLLHSQPHSFAGDLKPFLAAGRRKAKCDSSVPKTVQQSEHSQRALCSWHTSWASSSPRAAHLGTEQAPSSWSLALSLGVLVVAVGGFLPAASSRQAAPASQHMALSLLQPLPAVSLLLFWPWSHHPLEQAISEWVHNLWRGRPRIK